MHFLYPSLEIKIVVTKVMVEVASVDDAFFFQVIVSGTLR
jgi:hypothetical protein